MLIRVLNVGIFVFAGKLIDGLNKRAVGTKLINGVTLDQEFLEIMDDELLDLMGGHSTDGDVNNAAQVGHSPPVMTLARSSEGPTIVLLFRLHGVGKTTAVGKLVLYLKERRLITRKLLPWEKKQRNW